MTKTEETCIKWLNKNFNYMEPFIAKGYDGYVFHMKNGRCILQYNKINGYLHISYGEIWSFLESMFSMSFQEIRELTKVWAEQYYVAKINPITPLIYRVKEEIEEQYKMREVTTNPVSSTATLMMEEQYKMREVTTKPNHFIDLPVVEEQYKMKVVTAPVYQNLAIMLVEQQYKMNVKEVTIDMNSVTTKVEGQYTELINTPT
jgi:hypothetical protein